MAIRGVHFKWYDGFFLIMLAFSIVMVLLSWRRYHLCKFPLHLWIVVDYSAVFVFRLLMFVDNGLAAGMGLDFGRRQRDVCFYGRVVVLSILYVMLYPFLWAWSVTGSIWFNYAHTCLPEKNQKWGFLVWLIFSYCGLFCIAVYSVNKWLIRRKAHLERAQQGIPISGISEYGVLVDMIRLPDWVFESAAQEMRIMEQDATPHHPGLYLSDAQRQAMELLIQELPLFSLKAVPTDCSDCPICLEEFHVGDEVRGLPCAHNFHVACIDKWLRLNIKCPRCRCSVFPNLELHDLPNIPPDTNRSLTLSTTYHTQSQPISQSYLSRMQSFLMPIRSGNAASSVTNSSPAISNDSDVALEIHSGNAASDTTTATKPNSGTNSSTSISNDSDLALEINSGNAASDTTTTDTKPNSANSSSTSISNDSDVALEINSENAASDTTTTKPNSATNSSTSISNDSDVALEINSENAASDTTTTKPNSATNSSTSISNDSDVALEINSENAASETTNTKPNSATNSSTTSTSNDSDVALEIHSGNAASGTCTTNPDSATDSGPSISGDSDVALEIAENGGQLPERHDVDASEERVQ